MIDFLSAPAPGSGSPFKSDFTDADARVGGERLPVDTPESELPPYVAMLNPPQREAALTVDGPLMVLAGAGSGKTRMVTSRIAYLIDYCGVAPYRILAVTFTNKAAGEMKLRVEKALEVSRSSGALLGTPEIGTFHAVCTRILRREMGATPFTRPFVIYDDSDQLSLVKGVLEKLGIDSKAFNPKAFQGAINRMKCDAVEPHEVETTGLSPFERQLKRVYEQYQKDLFANNALDFGEIICLTYRVLRDHPEVRRKYQRQWAFVHVDEYQDTNRAQYLLLSQLVSREAGGLGNICVVGDEDQSIYKWRGADIRNILDFEKDFPGAKVVKLEQNYRSTQTIITAASHVIGYNRQRKDKRLWTSNAEGDRIQRVQFMDERTEAEYVVGEIKRLLLDESRSLDDFAIFYRTHAQSRQFEDVLRREKIAYQIVGGLRFYDRKEIKDIMAYLRVILNPSDSVSLMRIINVPARGIGATTLSKLSGMLFAEEAVETPDGRTLGEVPDLWSLLVKISENPSIFPGRSTRKLVDFVELMKRLMDRQPGLLLSELYHAILDEIGYVIELKKEGTPEALARIENLEELNTVIQEFEEEALKGVVEDKVDAEKPGLLPHFLEQTALVGEVDQPFDPSTIRLMTLHASKGLEFPVVFMVGMEDGLFPSTKPWEETSDEDVEEERRLCYVGMTRAEERLYMLNAVCRRIWGQMVYQDPSRFLAEIPDEFVDAHDLSYMRRPEVERPRASSGSGRKQIGAERESGGITYDFSDNGQELVGRKLNHPDYGRGTVLAVEGFGEYQKVTVEFQYRVRRKFLYRYVSRYVEL